MKYRTLLLVAALALAGLWVGWRWRFSAPQLPVIALPDLTPELRLRIDAVAKASPLETIEQEKINFTGDITAWLIGQTLPGPEEERSHAARMRKELLDKCRTVPTPDAAERMLRRLTQKLPPHLRSDTFEYSLTVLDVTEPNVFTCGGGPVYITRPLLEALLGARDRGEGALAFVLAHELGHMALLHCRRGWQLVELHEELDRGLALAVSLDTLRSLVQTGLAAAGSLVSFLYSRNQEYEADLFAFHLCQLRLLRPPPRPAPGPRPADQFCGDGAVAAGAPGRADSLGVCPALRTAIA